MLDRPVLQASGAPNEVWSIDFVMDSLVNGKRIKCLTVVDDFTRECLDIAVDIGISGEYVAPVLERIGQFRGLPKAIRADQGPEFTSRALDRWAHGRGIHLKLIAAGKPTQNAYIESFNGKFPEECLNDHYFNNLVQSWGDPQFYPGRSTVARRECRSAPNVESCQQEGDYFSRMLLGIRRAHGFRG